MESTQNARSTSRKIKKDHDRLREQELHPVHFWAPDVRANAFKAEASRQPALVAASPHEAEDQAFVDAASAGAWGDE